MKRILSVLLSLFLCFGMIACGGSEKEESAKESETSNTAIEVDENLLSVDITIPASFFEGEDMTTFDTTAYVEENNFNEAAVNQDGSVTVTMTKARHKEIVAEMQASTEESYQELINNTDMPYIENISHNGGFKTVTVEVDRAGYDNAFLDMTPFVVGFQSMFYQTFTGDKLHCEVVMKYSDTGDVISTTVYPDAIEDAELGK